MLETTVGRHRVAPATPFGWRYRLVGILAAAGQSVRLNSFAKACGVAVFTTGSMFWVWQAGGGWAADALTYRAGAVAFLAGADPWSAGHAGWSFAALPLTVFLFVPAALVPQPVFVAAWQALTIVSAIVIVRRLRLPWWWLLYPPLTIGVILGNPAIAGLAALVAGLPVIGLALRPHLVVSAGWRSVAGFGALVVVSFALMPTYLSASASVMARHAIESGAPVNLWASPGMVAAGVALLLLATVDRRVAAWLVVPAIGPSIGWYGFTMIMPLASLPLAVATSLPIHGLGAWAIAGYAIARFLSARAAFGVRKGTTVVPSGYTPGNAASLGLMTRYRDTLRFVRDRPR